MRSQLQIATVAFPTIYFSRAHSVQRCLLFRQPAGEPHLAGGENPSQKTPFWFSANFAAPIWFNVYI